MFDVGFGELVLIFLVALVVLGPERLPKAAATLGRFAGRARSYVRRFMEQLENEASDVDPRRDINRWKQEIGNVDPRHDMKKWKQDIDASMDADKHKQDSSHE